MSELLRWPTFVLVMATVLLSGWVHGLWSGRWQPEHELTEAVQRVDKVPMTVGPWSAETETPDDGEFYQAGAMSYWARRYTHAQTKESVLVILMCGRPGRMSTHTPEVCYQGAGFTLSGAPEAWTMSWQEIASESTASFWTAQFRKDGSTPTQLRLLWSWNCQGTWEALKNPRWETKGEPFLYKMYISLDGAGPRRGQEAQTADLRRAQEFLHEFLPRMQEALFSKVGEP
jgi:Protein of unknown function (DUF3485)